jgi:hypothetical protein
VKKNKSVILKYILELGERGVLDERMSSEPGPSHATSESSDTTESESSLSDSERVLTQPSSPASMDLEGNLGCEASGSTEDTHASTIQEGSSRKPFFRLTCDHSDAESESDSNTEPESHHEDADQCPRSPLPDQTTSSITGASRSSPKVPKPAFVEEIRDVDFLEEAHPNCDRQSGPSYRINESRGNFIPGWKNKEEANISSAKPELHCEPVMATSGPPLITGNVQHDVRKELDNLKKSSMRFLKTFLELSNSTKINLSTPQILAQ